MSLLIKGMEMPMVCGLCPFALSYAVNGLYTYCLASKDALGRLNIDTRHPDCPLKEVPVPVVRCKDCKHWGMHKSLNVPWCFKMHIDKSEDGYCDCGERKNDATD